MSIKRCWKYWSVKSVYILDQNHTIKSKLFLRTEMRRGWINSTINVLYKMKCNRKDIACWKACIQEDILSFEVCIKDFLSFREASFFMGLGGLVVGGGGVKFFLLIAKGGIPDASKRGSKKFRIDLFNYG